MPSCAGLGKKLTSTYQRYIINEVYWCSMNVSLWLIGLAAFIAFLIAIVPSLDSLIDRDLSGWRKFWKLYILLVSFGLSLLIIIVQFRMNEKSTEANNKRIDSIQRASEAKIRNGIDSGNHKLYNDLSIALGKQNLTLDTLNKELYKLKRDTSVKTVIISGEDPAFGFYEPGIKVTAKEDASMIVDALVVSKGASSTNFDIDFFIIAQYKDGHLQNLHSGKQIQPNEILVKDLVKVVGANGMADAEMTDIYVLIKGTYTNLTGSKKFKINVWHAYNIATKMEGALGNTYRKPFDDFVKEIKR